RQLTKLATQPMAAAGSPDGRRIAFLDIDAMWRRAGVSVVDVASGQITKIHGSLFGPGTPAWSPDGKRVAVAMVASYSRRFREGTNQILTMSAEGGGDKWFAPVPTLSIDSRGGCGPVWSPDGAKMAAIYEGLLTVWPVSASGEPLGPPRRVTTEMAHSPSWAGDSKRILYQSMDRLRILNIESGEVRDVPLDLKYTPAIPRGRMVVHAGRLVDGKSPAARSDVDILIEGNRIRGVEPHSASRHQGAAVVDASNLTVMPGLIEYHTHQQKDLSAAHGRAWLAFGITTVRSTGDTPYEAVEDREAFEAGVRLGPRIYATGYLMEWMRAFYKMGLAVSSPAHFEMELQRARVLQHDLIKGYVRMPDLQQKRMVEFAHSIGVPVSTHEIYPMAYVGGDHTEHTWGTSRRGFSPKLANVQRAYEDVIQILGKSRMIICPTMVIAGAPAGLQKLLAAEPGILNDPRFNLCPAWMRAELARQRNPEAAALPGLGAGSGHGRITMDAFRAGARVVAGTDSQNPFHLHGELMNFVLAGMTPYQALKAATVTAAETLGLDAGSIEAGKLADLVMVEGNPLEDIASTYKVRRVIANGRLLEMDDLLDGAAGNTPGRAR
ncbi:MAG: amidohydrolase family protein, partial [Bryobacterales bacterium]|nr:amidohydrolase family protein [Bryobacterales bacterium]